MKYTKEILKYVCFMVILLSIFSISVAAVSQNTGFEFDKAESDQFSNFEQQINLSFFKVEPKRRPAVCFNVSRNGLVSIGSEGMGSDKTVCVYSDSGDFLYGYSFETYGSFGVGFHDDQLTIYFARSDIALMLDDIGNIKDLMMIKDTAENNLYWKNAIFLIERDINGTVYTLENTNGIFNIFSMGSYSRLVICKDDGAETIFYESEFSNVLINIIIIAICFIMLVICIFQCYRKFKRTIFKK